MEPAEDETPAPASLTPSQPVSSGVSSGVSPSGVSSSGLKVVEHFEPSLKGSSSAGPKVMFDARTQRYVPTEQVNEHVRIEQMDPAWKKQQDVRRAREATTNLVDGQQMSETIHRMRAQREAERRRRLALAVARVDLYQPFFSEHFSPPPP